MNFTIERYVRRRTFFKIKTSIQGLLQESPMSSLSNPKKFALQVLPYDPSGVLREHAMKIKLFTFCNVQI